MALADKECRADSDDSVSHDIETSAAVKEEEDEEEEKVAHSPADALPRTVTDSTDDHRAGLNAAPSAGHTSQGSTPIVEIRIPPHADDNTNNNSVDSGPQEVQPVCDLIRAVDSASADSKAATQREVTSPQGALSEEEEQGANGKDKDGGKAKPSVDVVDTRKKKRVRTGETRRGKQRVNIEPCICTLKP